MLALSAVNESIYFVYFLSICGLLALLLAKLSNCLFKRTINEQPEFSVIYQLFSEHITSIQQSYPQFTWIKQVFFG